MIDDTTVNHAMLNVFVKRWHTETSSFHLPHSEMSITLEDVSCLLHISIRGRFLDHETITKAEALKIMVEYLRDNPREVKKELDITRCAYPRF